MSDKKIFIAKYGDVNHIDNALNDADYIVRITAIRNTNATNKNISKALDDKDLIVNNVAKEYMKRFI